MENAWQYSKVYTDHFNGIRPTDRWFNWSQCGFDNPRAVRYPMGRGVVPVGSWCDGAMLDYVAARKALYWPLYRNAVRQMFGWQHLRQLFRERNEITLWDFDGYQRGGTLREVVNDSQRKMGHAFVLAAMLIYGRDVTPEELP
jgi:hypothetical protein